MHKRQCLLTPLTFVSRFYIIGSIIIIGDNVRSVLSLPISRPCFVRKHMDDTIIRDESGDKKYFTQIPNMIVNHSTAYEQSLYLIMKRLAGEGGYCYASLNFLSKKMGADKKTVSQTISKLLKRKWIKETDKTKVRGGSVRTFVIIDLWKQNMANYKSGAQATTKNESGRQVTSKESGCQILESGRNFPESGRQTDTSKNSNKIYNKSDNLKILDDMRNDLKRKGIIKHWGRI